MAYGGEMKLVYAKRECRWKNKLGLKIVSVMEMKKWPCGNVIDGKVQLIDM